MRCAQIDSFPQNPAEPIPAGRASMRGGELSESQLTARM